MQALLDILHLSSMSRRILTSCRSYIAARGKARNILGRREVGGSGPASQVQVHAGALLAAEGRGGKMSPRPRAMIPDASRLQGCPVSVPTFGHSHPAMWVLVSVPQPPLMSLASLWVLRSQTVPGLKGMSIPSVLACAHPLKLESPLQLHSK